MKPSSFRTRKASHSIRFKRRNAPFVAEVNSEDVQDVLLEEEFDPTTRVVEKGAALSHGANLLMNDLEIGDEF